MSLGVSQFISIVHNGRPGAGAFVEGDLCWTHPRKNIVALCVVNKIYVKGKKCKPEL